MTVRRVVGRLQAPDPRCSVSADVMVIGSGSAGLTAERAREVAETGVDLISVGALTHSVKVFDLGLDLA